MTCSLSTGTDGLRSISVYRVSNNPSRSYRVFFCSSSTVVCSRSQEYQRGLKRRHAPDKDDEGWGDLIVFEDSYLTDEHRFVADTGSFQFCKDLEGRILNIDEIHTPQSTLLALLRDREIYLTKLTSKQCSPSGDTSSRLGLAQESDDELLFLESCFQAQGIKGPQAKTKAN